MQFMLLIYTDGGADGSWDSLSEEEQKAILAEYGAISQTPGVVGGAQLAPVTSATTVEVRDGRTLTTDGPFAETKEVLGGFYTVEADNIDTALEVAARIPAARMGGKVEVRPLIQM